MGEAGPRRDTGADIQSIPLKRGPLPLLGYARPVRSARCIGIIVVALTESCGLFSEDATPSDVRGVVLDANDRPLPFVVVTSRTGNGFLSVWTDLSGQFAFPHRHHGRNSSLLFTAAGYDERRLPVADDTAFMAVTLAPAPERLASGWSIGLIERPMLAIRTAAGRSLSPPYELDVQQRYSLIVTARGSGSCTRKGPVTSGADSLTLTAAAAMFVRGGVCTRDLVEHEWVIPFVLQGRGSGRVRFIGKLRDEAMPVIVR